MKYRSKLWERANVSDSDKNPDKKSEQVVQATEKVNLQIHWKRNFFGKIQKLVQLQSTLHFDSYQILCIFIAYSPAYQTVFTTPTFTKK